MRAVPASSLGLERLVQVWNAAYAGYFVPMSWDVAQLERHVTAGSIDLDRSLAWMDGPTPIALSLLGVRPDVSVPRGLGVASSAHSTGGLATSSVQDLPGQPSSSSAHDSPLNTPSSAHDSPPRTGRARARNEHSTGESSVQKASGERGWIGGFGIIPSHRGRGLAARLMREHLDVARQSGVGRVQLEVLTQNWAARSYERAGFVTTRRLSVLQGSLRRADPRGTSTTVTPTSPRLEVAWAQTGDVPDAVAQLERLHAAYPAAWTREPASTMSDPDGLHCLTVGSVGALEGALLLREHDQTLQVVDAVAVDEGAAERLVAGLVAEHVGRDCRVVNEPEGSPLIRAFSDAGLVEVLAQHEMHWTA